MKAENNKRSGQDFGQARAGSRIGSRLGEREESNHFWAGRSVPRAFTLIEIMIAITIFSVVLLAIYSSWTAILRSSKVGLAAAAEAQRTRMALRALEEALGSAELYTANLRYYSFLADTGGDFAALSFVAHLPSSFPGSGLFRDQPVRRVTFSVEPGPNSQNQLVLRQSPLLEPPESQEQPYTIVLAPGVSRFEMEFLDTNSVEWLPEWPATNKLPKVVRVALGLGPRGRISSRPEDLAIQTVFLTSVPIPRELQIPIVGRGVAPPTADQTGRNPSANPGQVPRISNPRGAR